MGISVAERIIYKFHFYVNRKKNIYSDNADMSSDKSYILKKLSPKIQGFLYIGLYVKSKSDPINKNDNFI
jgi:hypothetical protein